MKALDEIRRCNVHGKTMFKHKQNAKGQWWVCHECLKIQWKRASAKRRKLPEVREYQKEIKSTQYQLIKSLSLSLRLILIAAFYKPE